MTILFSSNFKLLIVLLFLTYKIQDSLCQPALPVLHGAFIYDFFGDQTKNDILANQWTIHGLNNSLTSKAGCASLSIIGGPNVLNSGGYFERIYTSLPVHETLCLYINVYLIDDWQSPDHFDIQIDNFTPISVDVFPMKLSFPYEDCGNATVNDMYDFLFIKIFHNSSSLNLKIIPYISKSSNLASLAFRDVMVLFRNHTNGFIEEKCSIFAKVGGNNPCSCGFGYYRNSNTSACVQCSPACNHCYGPNDTDCFICRWPLTFNGIRCTSHSIVGCLLYSYLDNRCTYCTSGYILLWNGTCVPNNYVCTLPHILETVDAISVCKTPCQSNSTHMMWNGSCIGSCDFPLVKRMDGFDAYCDYPCNAQTNQYLYSNGSCGSSCVFFSRVFGGYNFCDHCSAGNFMYPNLSCISVCQYPRIQRFEGGYYFCDSPCSNNLMYYYKTEGKCRSSCEYPKKVDDSIFCMLDLSEESMQSLKTVSNVMNTAGYLANITTNIIRIINFANPSAIFFGSVAELMKYIKYLKIQYPPKLQYILDQPQLEGLFSSIFAIPEHIENYFIKQSLPDNFEKYEFHSSFTVNFWGSLVCLLIILLIIFTTFLAKFCFPKDGLIYYSCTKLNEVVKWNIFLSFFLGYYGDISLMTSLEIISLDLDSFFSAFSFVICILTNIVAIALLVKVFFIIKEIIMTRNKYQNDQSNRLQMTKEKWKEYEVMFATFKDDSLIQKSFLLIFSIRLYIFNAVITYLFDHPLVQTILLTLISFCLLLYLVIKRPFTEKKDLIEYIVQEGVLQVLNISVLILACMDAANSEAADDRERLGDFIIVLNTGFTTLSSIYLIILTIWRIKELVFKFTKRKSNQKRRKIFRGTIDEISEKKPAQKEDISISADQCSTIPQPIASETMIKKLTMSDNGHGGIVFLNSEFNPVTSEKRQKPTIQNFKVIWRGNKLVNRSVYKDSEFSESPSQVNIINKSLSQSSNITNNIEETFDKMLNAINEDKFKVMKITDLS